MYFQEQKRKVKLETIQKIGVLAAKRKQAQRVQTEKKAVEHYKYKKMIPNGGSLPTKQEKSLVETNLSMKRHKERQRMLQ